MCGGLILKKKASIFKIPYLRPNMNGEHHIKLVGSHTDVCPSVTAHGDSLARARTAHLLTRYHITISACGQASLEEKKINK